MSTPELTETEIIETLKRSSLPTIITEGKDDYSVFRFLEDEMGALSVSVMPVGGKQMLLKVLDRRHELPVNPFFIVDKDLWIFSGIPAKYREISCVSFSHGYSIENDIYQDGNLENLMSLHERRLFLRDIKELCVWYAFAVSNISMGGDASLTLNPRRILCGTNRKMTDEFKSKISFIEPDPETVASIMLDYRFLLRGKTLLALLAQYLSKPKRRAKHSFNGLLEIGASARGPLVSITTNTVRSYFSKLS